MVTHRVTAAALSVLFDTDINIERVPEPFRLQPGLVLSIPYSEYLSFVHSLSQDSLIDLYPSTQVVLEQLQAQSIKNYQGYLLNVAFAICKELHFATVYKMEPTVILPSSDTSTPIPWRNYVAQTAACWSTECGLLDIMQRYGLRIEPRSSQSVLLWNLARCIFKALPNYMVEGVLNLTE